MKRLVQTSLLLAGAVLLAGCFVPSLKPFCPDTAVVELPELDGKWRLVSQGEEDITAKYVKPWVFGGGEMKTYDGSLSSVLSVKYFRAGSNTFADLTVNPEDLEGKCNAWSRIHILMAHSVCKVSVGTNAVVEFTPMSGDWVKKLADDGKLPVAHTRVDDDMILLTAPSPELFEFVNAHAGDTNAFPAGATYTFKRAEPFKLFRRSGVPNQ